jgi:hypothetical protein
MSKQLASEITRVSNALKEIEIQKWLEFDESANQAALEVAQAAQQASEVLDTIWQRTRTQLRQHLADPVLQPLQSLIMGVLAAKDAAAVKWRERRALAERALFTLEERARLR